MTEPLSTSENLPGENPSPSLEVLEHILRALELYDVGLVIEACEIVDSLIDSDHLDDAQRALTPLLSPSLGDAFRTLTTNDSDANDPHDAPTATPGLAARIEKLSKSGKLFASNLTQFAAQLDKDMDLIDAALSGLEDDSGYEVVRDDEFQIKYRNVKGDPIHSLKCSVALEAPPWEMMAICREWDLIPLWNHLMFDAMELAAASVTKIWAYSASWLPWPFKPRSAIIGFHGVNLLRSRPPPSSSTPSSSSTSSIPRPSPAPLSTDSSSRGTRKERKHHAKEGFLVLFSTENDGVPPFFDPHPIPEADKDRVRVHSLPGSCIVLTPIDPALVPPAHRKKPKSSTSSFTAYLSSWFTSASPNANGKAAEEGAPQGPKPPGTRATVLMHLDPKIASPPSWLIHWALRTFFPFIYKRVVKTLDRCFDGNSLPALDQLPSSPQTDLQGGPSAAEDPGTRGLEQLDEEALDKKLADVRGDLPFVQRMRKRPELYRDILQREIEAFMARQVHLQGST